MYRDLQVDYERKLAWAKSLGIGAPFTEVLPPEYLPFSGQT